MLGIHQDSGGNVGQVLRVAKIKNAVLKPVAVSTLNSFGNEDIPFFELSD